MGKKPKKKSGHKAASRKIDLDSFPPPPPPVEKEEGSTKLLDEPSIQEDGFRVLGSKGYDDGGVADLSLLIDLEDNVQRRRLGDKEYFRELKADQLPRATKGPMGDMSRREQKVSLAQLLFSETEDCEDKGPSEVYVDQGDEDEDKAISKARKDRVTQARAALRMSLMLREAACTSLSLSELCKRTLTLKGKAGAEEALRCAGKALEISGDGFWDGGEAAIEAEDNPVVDPKYEKNAATPGLAHPSTLRLLPLRVAHLCKRSALLQKGNALAAMGREDEAIESYKVVLPLIKDEPRCSRIDWERHSVYINIGNSFSRKGDFEIAVENFKIGEKIGKDQIGGGNIKDGKGMVACAKRARAFALKRAGKLDDAKKLLKEVVDQRIADNFKEEKEKKAHEEAAARGNLEQDSSPLNYN